jgi:hypothetical protein
LKNLFKVDSKVTLRISIAWSAQHVIRKLQIKVIQKNINKSKSKYRVIYVNINAFRSKDYLRVIYEFNIDFSSKDYYILNCTFD